MKTIIVGGFSGIAQGIIKSLDKDKDSIIYTYNSTFSKKLNKFRGFKLKKKKKKSIDKFSKIKEVSNWGTLLIMPATQKPIGLFSETDPREWANSIELNFINQMYLINRLYKKRSLSEKNKTIILWAGGGTNNATKYYSAYTISKIAQIKMAELLNHEMKDTKVVILGPGWVKTKIHNETLNNKKLSRENYQRTQKRFLDNNFVEVKEVVDCVNTIINSSKSDTGGRNLSVEFDRWKNTDLFNLLSFDDDIYTLRRDFNNFNFEDLKFSIDNLIFFLDQNKNLHLYTSSIFKFFQRLTYFKYKIELSKKKIINILNIEFKFPKSLDDKKRLKKIFNLYDILILNFYQLNKKKYRNILELGAGSGIHSVFLNKKKIKTKVFENDLNNYKATSKMLNLNKINLKITNSKNINLNLLFSKYDLIKIDSKFYEKKFLEKITTLNLEKKKILMKVHSKNTKNQLWNIIRNKKYIIKSQKNGWKNIIKLDNIPSNQEEGFILI